jgi:hypothetical protein
VAYIFGGDDENDFWELENHFSPFDAFKRLVESCVNFHGMKAFRLARFPPDREKAKDLKWFVYVAEAGPLFAYKDKGHRWEPLGEGKCLSRANRPRVNIRTKGRRSDGENDYCAIDVSIIRAWTWHPEKMRLNSIVEHKRDNPAESAARDLSPGTHASNARTMHRLKCGGASLPTTPVSIAIPRELRDRLRVATGKKGRHLHEYIAVVIAEHLRNLASRGS